MIILALALLLPALCLAQQGGFSITKVLPDKLLYDTGQTVKVAVTVANTTAAPQSGELRVRLEWEMDEGVELARQPITLQPKEAKTLIFPWKSVQVLGVGAYAELVQDGKVLSAAHDFFNVVDAADALRVSIHAGWGAQEPVEKLDRTNYVNVYEVLGWGGNPTPTATNPPEEYAGHYGWVTKANLRKLCANPVGVKFLAYVICYTFKSDAERFAVEHPEKFLYDKDGYFCGTFDMQSNERQGRNPRYKQQNYYGDFSSSLDWADQQNLDWWADEISKSAKDIGWQGVRFDGHPQFIAPQSLEYYRWDGKYYNLEEKLKVNARDTPYFKDKLRAANPNFLLYYNCEPVLDKLNPPIDLADICRNGSTAGSEVTRSAADVSNPYHKWKDMYNLFIDGVDACRKHGGYYSAIFPAIHAGMGVEAKHLGTALMMATGTQQWFVEWTRPEKQYAAPLRQAIVPYLKMSTRYSALLWGHGITRLPNPESWIAVATPPGSEVWWQRTVNTRKTVGGNELVIVNLLNAPPTEENLGTKQTLPKPIDNIILTFRPHDGKRVVKVWDINAWPDTTCQPLPLAEKDGTVSVTVPRMDYFRMVVAELK
jgi:hypothetical protein